MPQLRLRLLLFGLGRGNRLLEILQRQAELIGIEPLRVPAELHALQLADQLAQPVVLLGEPGLLGAFGIALGPRRQHQRTQRRDILGQGLRVGHGPLSHRANPAGRLNLQVSQKDAGLSQRPLAGRSAAHAPAANRALRTTPPAALPKAALPRR